ncbi:MAG: hypothetical protein H3C53_04170 [Trueperaceae bacterium]|nr:hypothetical protein [Trueperaceae bacterium]
MRRYAYAGLGLLVASLVALVVKAIVIPPAVTKVDAGITASIGPFLSDVNFLEVAACLGVAVGILLIVAGLSGAPKGILGYRV